MKVISTDKAPAAIGPYSQAIVAGDFLYASGQIPINPATGNVEAEGIEAQATQAIINVGEILKAAGFPDNRIELSSTHLADKKQQKNHPFDLSDVFLPAISKLCLAVISIALLVIFSPAFVIVFSINAFPPF